VAFMAVKRLWVRGAFGEDTPMPGERYDDERASEPEHSLERQSEGVSK
jgi:hypothetical protein